MPVVVSTSKIIFHLSLFEESKSVAGEADEPRCSSFFFSLLCLCTSFLLDEGTDFSKGSDCLQFETGEEKLRRKVAWVLQRP